MRAFLGLGANLGDSEQTLAAVPAALRARAILVTNASRMFRSAPVGGPAGQPDYVNQVLEIRTLCSPRELLEACHAIEFAFGRDRSVEERHGPRTIDLDILAIKGQTVDQPDLIVPHPRLPERAFVLVPLAEIAPELEIPPHGTVTSLLVALGDTSGVRPLN
jgi:2-amino-4-hydroxy-6-hydroxymethyldihydropteridine diphosphokinase